MQMHTSYESVYSLEQYDSPQSFFFERSPSKQVQDRVRYDLETLPS